MPSNVLVGKGIQIYFDLDSLDLCLFHPCILDISCNNPILRAACVWEMGHKANTLQSIFC